jgi:putative DNA primase/helicase
VSGPGLDAILAELRPALRSCIAALAESLLGQPTIRRKRELRWGAKGSFRVIISGPKQGACCNFESGWKGDPLRLIENERHTDFIGAVKYGCDYVGIAFDRQGTQEDPAARRAREAEQARQRAERDAGQEADEGRRIAYARHLWNASGPIHGTAASVYLEITRAIPRPATGWPDAVVRYHAGTASLILAGTCAMGEVRFVQRIRLTIDGRKADGTPKLTSGVMDGAFVRLPGPTDSPLLLAEGPETALSVWAATEYTTLASIGSIARHTPPVNRRVVICRDDDRLQSPADRALKLAMATWHGAGLEVITATPWNVRREDKSDFNDVIQVVGIEAVRIRIAAALDPLHDRIPRLTIEAGQVALQTAIDDFYTKLLLSESA